MARRIKRQLPDVIRQWEIEALFGANTAVNQIAYGFRRRLDAGATVEPGKYWVEADGPIDLDKEFPRGLRHGGGNETAGIDASVRRGR